MSCDMKGVATCCDMKGVATCCDMKGGCGSVLTGPGS